MVDARMELPRSVRIASRTVRMISRSVVWVSTRSGPSSPPFCVAVPAGVAGFTVLGGRFVVHWRPAEAAADETVKWGLGVVCMVMAGYSLLDSLVGDVCVGFYFRAAYFPSVVLQRIVTAKLHSGWAKREGDGWPPFCVPSKWNGLGSTEGSVRAGMSGGWCCSMWWGASEGPLTCLPSAPGKAKGG